MAGLSLSLLLVAGLVTWRLVADRPYVVPPGDPAASASPAGASRVLRVLEQALTEGDAGAAERLAAPGDDAAARLLRGLADNARAARVTDLSLRYVTELDGVDPQGRWPATVDVAWAFDGFDETAAVSEVRMVFRQVDGEVHLAGVGGGDALRTPVWLSGPVEVRRSARTLVLVQGSARDATRMAGLAEAAVPVVARVLPRADLRLVVEAPRTVAGLHRALDADPGTYDRIAAVTTSVDGTQGPDAPVHVFVNPDVFGGLRSRGAQVVMSHEAVHVATDAAAGGDLPTWLLEGFADYVALRDVALPVTVTAGQVIEQVRRRGVPDRLPGPGAFDTETPRLGASYEAAWLACRLLGDLGGDAALVRFYRAVEGGLPVGRALRAEYGLTVAELTRRWQDLLADLAR